MLAGADIDVTIFGDSKRRFALSELFASMAQADVRIVGALAYSLRETGNRVALLELTRSVAAGRGDILCLDSVLPELIRLCARTGKAIRNMNLDALSVADTGGLPSGMNMYFYPGMTYFEAWSGMVCIIATGAALLEEPRRLLPGIIALALLPVGGLLDLLIWNWIGVWQNPEKSRWAFVAQGGTIVLLVSLVWIVHMFEARERMLAGLGLLAGMFLSHFPLFTRWGRLLLYSNWKSWLKWLGTLAYLGLGWGFAVVLHRVLPDWRPFLAGAFLAGCFGVGFALAILPLRLRVRRFSESARQPSHL